MHANCLDLVHKLCICVHALDALLGPDHAKSYRIRLPWAVRYTILYLFCSLVHSGKGVSLQVPHWRVLTANVDNIATAVLDEDTNYVCKLSQKHQATVKMFKGKVQVRHWLGGIHTYAATAVIEFMQRQHSM